jgi:hypothetical protein
VIPSRREKLGLRAIVEWQGLDQPGERGRVGNPTYPALQILDAARTQASLLRELLLTEPRGLPAHA